MVLFLSGEVQKELVAKLPKPSVETISTIAAILPPPAGAAGGKGAAGAS